MIWFIFCTTYPIHLISDMFKYGFLLNDNTREIKNSFGVFSEDGGE